MLFLISLLAFVTIFILVYLALTAYAPVQGPIEMRLKALEGLANSRTDIDQELVKPFSQRIVSPFTSSLAAFVMRLTPGSIKKLVGVKLAMAGGFGNLGVEEFLLLCGFLSLAFPALTIFAMSMLKAPANKVTGLALIAFVLGIMLPFLLLNKKMAERKMSIQKDLPDVLDLLTVSVEAGLSFDGALTKLSEKMKGALVDEFYRVLQEIRMGISRRDALVAMGIRCDVADLSLFTTALVQADQLGVGIGNVLRVQSIGMREKRKQRIEERAMKAPIKMMIPLVLFIFPTIFIVLLGPAVIQVIEALGNK